MRKEIIEAVRNKQSGKLFVLLDDSHGVAFKLVNPAGQIVNLPARLFDEEALVLTAGEPDSEITPEQLITMGEFNARAAASAENEIQRLAAPPKAPSVAPSRSSSSSAAGPVRRPKSEKSKSAQYRMPPVTWSATRLTFYRHKIQPLAPHQTLCITVDGVGDFEMTKEDFLSAFNDVVMAPSYRSEGIFSYPEVPEKALRFLKT